MKEVLTDDMPSLKGAKRVVGVQGNVVVTLDIGTNVMENWTRDELLNQQAGQSLESNRAIQRQLSIFDSLGYDAVQHRIMCTSCHMDWDTRKPTFINLELSDGSDISLEDAIVQLGTFNTLEQGYLKRLTLLCKNGLSGMYLPDVGGAVCVGDVTKGVYVHADIQVLDGAKHFIPLLEVLDNSLLPIVQQGDRFFLVSAVIYENADEKQCFPVYETAKGTAYVYWYTKGQSCLHGNEATSSALATALCRSNNKLEDKSVYDRYMFGLYAKCFNQLDYMKLKGLLDNSKVTLFNGSVGTNRLIYTGK